jgi:hypothetical protein
VADLRVPFGAETAVAHRLRKEADCLVFLENRHRDYEDVDVQMSWHRDREDIDMQMVSDTGKTLQAFHQELSGNHGQNEMSAAIYVYINYQRIENIFKIFKNILLKLKKNSCKQRNNP